MASTPFPSPGALAHASERWMNKGTHLALGLDVGRPIWLLPKPLSDPPINADPSPKKRRSTWARVDEAPSDHALWSSECTDAQGTANRQALERGLAGEARARSSCAQM